MNISTLIPIIIFVVVSVIVIGIIFLVTKPKKSQNQINLMPITPHKDDIKVVSLDTKEEEVKEDVKTEVKEEVKEKEEVVVQKEEKHVTPIIDIPIKEMDDSPITIEEAKSLVEESGESAVKIEEQEPVEQQVEIKEEDNVLVSSNDVQDNNEVLITTIEEPVQDNIVDTTQEVVVEDNNILVNEEPTENVLINTMDEEPREVKMIDNAFVQTPDGNNEINTDIKVEDKREYAGNKTEIFDLEEIKRAMGNKE